MIQNDFSNEDETKKNQVEFAVVADLVAEERAQSKYSFSEILMSQTLFAKTQQILIVYKEIPIEFINKSAEERS